MESFHLERSHHTRTKKRGDIIADLSCVFDGVGCDLMQFEVTLDAIRCYVSLVDDILCERFMFL